MVTPVGVPGGGVVARFVGGAGVIVVGVGAGALATLEEAEMAHTGWISFLSWSRS